jgi:hypothetical protein
MAAMLISDLGVATHQADTTSLPGYTKSLILSG